MYKSGILNSEISSTLSYMGHTDTICIADCGLPIPENVKRIDLALKEGVPSFIETFKEVSKHMKIEKIILADEIKNKNNEILKQICDIFENYEVNFKVEFISHQDFKEKTSKCKAIIRTGEMSPYANVILQANCIF